MNNNLNNNYNIYLKIHDLIRVYNTMATETQQQEQQTQMTSGRVKWFNNKAGYGFVSVQDCETKEERDIFVHHTEIKVGQNQYKYLVQGEYVEFMIGPITRDGKLDVHATGVSGINGGKLMCETRNEVQSYRSAKPHTKSHTQPREVQQRQPQQREVQQRQPQQYQPQQRQPQLAQDDQVEWMVVPRRRVNTVSQPRQETTKRGRQPTIAMSS